MEEMGDGLMRWQSDFLRSTFSLIRCDGKLIDKENLKTRNLYAILVYMLAASFPELRSLSQKSYIRFSNLISESGG